jgi:hypothetical protein
MSSTDAISNSNFSPAVSGALEGSGIGIDAFVNRNAFIGLEPTTQLLLKRIAIPQSEASTSSGEIISLNFQCVRTEIESAPV